MNNYIDTRVTGVKSINSVTEEIEKLKVTKQDTLVSGTNIKSINNSSILGEGNVNLGVLSENITTVTTVGSLPAGTTLTAGTSIEAIIKRMLGVQ